jgi:choice-of-anchor B domain-containing protein
MKKNITILFLLIVFTSVGQVYPSLNVSMLGNVAPEIATNWYGNQTRYSGCYGWYNPADGKEYAILGTTQGNYFIDISNPSNPVIVDYVQGAAQNSLWREIRTYQNYAYLVSDDSNNKLQIVDLSYLPDSVHVVYESNALFTRSHTIFIDGHLLYCGGVTKANNTQYAMAVYDITVPDNPVFLRALNQDAAVPGYVHDMFVRNDTVYASGGNAGLYMFRYNQGTNNFTPLASFTSYPTAGYNHSSSLTPDGKTLLFTDEVPTNTPVKILDVSDFGNLAIADTIKSNQGATPHNPYVIGNTRASVSYYQDGVAIFDISDPHNVSVAGFFDTDPAHGVNDNYSSSFDYQGCWGTYPYLPSGILLASDMQNGLFILDASQALGVKSVEQQSVFNVFPNPAQEVAELVFTAKSSESLSVSVFDIRGSLLKSFTYDCSASLNTLNLPVHDLSVGCYFIKVAGQDVNRTSKLIIAR